MLRTALLLALAAPPSPMRRQATLNLGPGAQVRLEAQVRERAGQPNQMRLELRGPGGKQTLELQTDAGASLAFSAMYLADVDFDGYLDLLVLREFGAKWGRYEVWRYDPKARAFKQTPLTRALDDLPNLEVDAARRRLVTSTIGPDAPSFQVYRVEAGQLELEESCRFENGGRAEGVLVRTRDGKKERAQHRAAPATDGFVNPCQPPHAEGLRPVPWEPGP